MRMRYRAMLSGVPSSPPTGRCTRRSRRPRASSTAFLPQVGELGGVDVVVCPPYTGAATAVELRSQSRGRRIAAQNMHEEPRARSPARSRRRCCVEIGVDGVILGHSERRQYFGETDEALGAQGPGGARGRARCRSSASARRRRSATRTRPRRAAAPARAPTSQRSRPSELARLVIAYEPIWAIGTGRNATPEQAAGGDRVHPLGGRRARATPRRPRSGSSTGARSSPPTPPSCSRPTGSTARLVGGASLDPETFARSACGGEAVSAAPPRRRSAVARRPRRLGARPRRPGERDQLRPRRRSSTGSGSDTRTPRLTAGGRDGRAARRADGQLRGRPPEPRRRRGRQAGPGAHRRRDRRRQLLREPVLLEACEAAPTRAPRPAAPDRAASRTAASTRAGSTSRRASSWPRARAFPTSSCTRSPTAATRCRTRRPATSRRSSAGCAAPGGSGPSAAATTRWTATGAGSGPSSPTTRSSTPPGCRADDAEAAIREAYERGETDEFIRPTVIGDYDGMADGDAVLHFNFRPDRARRADRWRSGEPDFAEFERGRAAGRLPRDDDRVPRRLALPGRVSAARARDDARRGDRRARRAPAPRRRDREVRPRHLLLQRRSRAGVGGGGAPPRRLAARRADLRPQARDERRGQPPTRSPTAGGHDGYRFGIINFANADMVGHTGVIPAAIAAVEAVDALPRRGRRGGRRKGGVPASSPPTTATPSNMLEPDGSPNTAHSINPVPLVVTVDGRRACATAAILADVAPTVLALLGIEQPAGDDRRAR